MLVFNRDSTRVAGGTERATDGGLLGGALEGARATGGFAGEAGVDLSSLYKIIRSSECELRTLRGTGPLSTRESLSRTSKYLSP